MFLAKWHFSSLKKTLSNIEYSFHYNIVLKAKLQNAFVNLELTSLRFLCILRLGLVKNSKQHFIFFMLKQSLSAKRIYLHTSVETSFLQSSSSLKSSHSTSHQCQVVCVHFSRSKNKSKLNKIFSLINKQRARFKNCLR